MSRPPYLSISDSLELHNETKYIRQRIVYYLRGTQDIRLDSLALENEYYVSEIIDVIDMCRHPLRAYVITRLHAEFKAELMRERSSRGSNGLKQHSDADYVLEELVAYLAASNTIEHHTKFSVKPE